MANKDAPKRGKKATAAVKPTDLSGEEKNIDQHILLEWEAWEYLYHERGVVWYVVAGVLTVGLIVYALLTQAWTMAIVVALLAGVVYLYAHEPPRLLPVMITKLGLHIGDEIYPYSHLRSYWFIIEHDIQAVCFETLGTRANVLVVQLGDQDPVKIREVLATEIPEEVGREETFLDKLMRLLKI